MRNDWLTVRLAELKALGRAKSKAGLAAALGMDATRISDMVAQRRKRFTYSEVLKIAAYLEWQPAQVAMHVDPQIGEDDQIDLVWVLGTVEAGVWAEALEWPREDWKVAPVAKIPGHSAARQFGLEVRGPSMDELYPPGSIVVCVKLIDLGRDPRPGERVIVQRRSDLGVEATVKELRQDEHGTYWLWPRSRHPEFQQPWKLQHNGEPDQAGVDGLQIVALVVGSYRPE